MSDPAPQQFALQFWDVQKHANATWVLGIMGMLIGSKGSNVRTLLTDLLLVIIEETSAEQRIDCFYTMLHRARFGIECTYGFKSPGTSTFSRTIWMLMVCSRPFVYFLQA
jgi:hypothetical protein